MYSPNRRQRIDSGSGSLPLSRRALTGAAASALMFPALGAPPAAGAVASRQDATPTASSGELTIKGISYDTGTNVPGFGVLTRAGWEVERVRADIAAIRDDLHCTAIDLFGAEADRLIESAEIALEQGLRAWIQPRVIDAEHPALLGQLIEVAREAERLRASSPDVTLNLGAEFTLLATGIIPGATFGERVTTLFETLDQLPAYNEQLNDLLARANAAARDVFHGPVTYGSGSWEEVDWSSFDFVSVDLYPDATNQDRYVDQLRSFQRHRKPVVITEFGCCSYEGAAEAGAAGADIIDWTHDPPMLNGEYARSEHVQADFIGDLVDLYRPEGIHGAFVYTFVEPAKTYSPDPRYDLDMASFGIVKVLPDEARGQNEPAGCWEPKQAFQVVAEAYADA